jgi:predicted dehydrogenase
VKRPGPQPEFGFEKLPAPVVEPLRAELEAFVTAVRSRIAQKTNGKAGRAALELASRVMESISEHEARVQPVAQTKREKMNQ